MPRVAMQQHQRALLRTQDYLVFKLTDRIAVAQHATLVRARDDDRLSANLIGNVAGIYEAIQVVFAREKAVADQAVDNVHSWLSRMRSVYPDTTVFQQPLPVYNVYVQPYFRVRVGDFTTRESAEELLTRMIADYPRAFVMVDQINVRR